MPSKIMLLEDDESSAAILQHVAKNFNCELIWKQDQESAEALLRSTPLDLAFLDVRLMSGSGLDVFRMMKRESIDVPVCFLTAYLNSAVLDEIRAVGIAAIMVKPDDFSQSNISRLFRTFGIKPLPENGNPQTPTNSL